MDRNRSQSRRCEALRNNLSGSAVRFMANSMTITGRGRSTGRRTSGSSTATRPTNTMSPTNISGDCYGVAIV